MEIETIAAIIIAVVIVILTAIPLLFKLGSAVTNTNEEVRAEIKKALEDKVLTPEEIDNIIRVALAGAGTIVKIGLQLYGLILGMFTGIKAKI